jgi:hypothetical protein
LERQELPTEVLDCGEFLVGSPRRVPQPVEVWPHLPQDVQMSVRLRDQSRVKRADGGYMPPEASGWAATRGWSAHTYHV